MSKSCVVCRSLSEKLKIAKGKNDLAEARIAYDQMREHLSRVKYPCKHGWNSEA